MTKPRAWLKTLRLQMGLTQRQFAQRLGYAQSIYSRLERGVQEPAYMVDFLDDVSALTQVSTEKLFRMESDRRHAERPRIGEMFG